MRALPGLLLMAAGFASMAAQTTGDAPAGWRPEAIVDLRTPQGAQLVHGQWRYRDAQVVQVAFRAPGPDLKPSGAPNRTYDISPHAGAVDFDDSGWPVIEATTLEARRSLGRLSFGWYRLKVTIPERLGTFDPTGSTAIFEIAADDYAEIWLDGNLPLVLGEAGGQLIKGWNAPNRVVLGHDVKPGQRFQLAVFAINGPLSDPPANYVWIRSATLSFYKPDQAGGVQPVMDEIVRLNPALDDIVPGDAKIEKIAGGFQFTEGPIWIRDGGYLLFSDPNANAIYRWTPDGQVSVFRTKSGYTGADIGEYNQPGSNGLTLDRDGRLTIDEHGNRRVTRLEKNGVLTVLAEQYEGKRLNSPNDLVYRSDGALYFTDPPFGLPKFYDDPRKELPFSGVFLLKDGRLKVVSTDLLGPNGLAFSPDEKYLYVDNWDVKKKVIMRYEVRPDGSLSNGTVFVDATPDSGEQAWDGLKVDQGGNVYAAGPGGVWIMSPAGRHLGTIKAPEQPANMAWGDDDGRTLYLAARTSVYRVRLKVPGIRP